MSWLSGLTLSEPGKTFGNQLPAVSQAVPFKVFHEALPVDWLTLRMKV